jgi:hypothetical protein
MDNGASIGSDELAAEVPPGNRLPDSWLSRADLQLIGERIGTSLRV